MLAGRAEEALGMSSFASCLGTEPVRACWKGRLIRKPLIAARGAAEIVRRQAFAQPAGALLRAIPRHVGDHLPGSAAKSNPEPALAFLLAANEAPEFIEFEHVTFLRGQKRLVQPGKRCGLFFPPSSARSGVQGPKVRRIARVLMRSHVAARTICSRSSLL